jgi:hypothetical protein
MTSGSCITLHNRADLRQQSGVGFSSLRLQTQELYSKKIHDIMCRSATVLSILAAIWGAKSGYLKIKQIWVSHVYCCHSIWFGLLGLGVEGVDRILNICR